MKPEAEKPLGLGSWLLAGAVLSLWIIWRVISGKGPSVVQKSSASATEKSPAEAESRSLPSLSSNQPNTLPLDRMKHSAEGGTLVKPESSPATPRRTVISPDNIAPSEEVLRTQSLDAAPLPGWSLPVPNSLPLPTFAPAIMAMGIVFVAMGFVSKWYVGGVGAVIFAVAARRWVEELQGD
ncbi:MAG: hypothetical protein ACRD20_14845 [Terriglobales bacterium]